MEVIIWYLTAFKHQTAVHNNLLMMMCMYNVHALAREFELAKMMSLKIVEKQFVHKLPKHKVCSTNFSVCYETSDVSKKWAAISGIFNSVSSVKFLYLAILPSLYLYFGFHQCFDDTNTHTSPTRCTNEWIKSKDLSAKRPISRLWCEHSQILCSKHAFAKKKIFRNDEDRW